ncbi:MAG: glycosyltransferase family 4 protein [Verrucomicrobiota bacterium]|nr:glycosyltransferase family 4 protein [Verrucomicrobiota bacterium]
MEHLLACRLLDVTETCGTKIDRVIGLKFPAYHIQHPDKVLWVLHQHRGAFDLWSGPNCDLGHYPNGRAIRDGIDHVEKKLLGEAGAVYANSKNVATRLEKYSGIASTPLYHPPEGAERFYCSDAGDYFYYPSRICVMKRQELVLRALAECKADVRVIFSGHPDSPDYYNELKTLTTRLKLDQRVQWLGAVSEEDKLRLYAESRAILYVPIDEDYGYITLESFLAGKPLICCTDSGGPLEFIEDSVNGWVSEPTPGHLAKILDEAWNQRSACKAFGMAGNAKLNAMDITWKKVVSTLTK